MNWQRIYRLIRRLLAKVLMDRRQGGILLVSFLLAVVLWFFVALTQEYTSSIRVPVTIDVDESVISQGQSSFDVDVQVKGAGLDLLLEHIRVRRDTVHLGFTTAMLETESVSTAGYREQFGRIFNDQLSVTGVLPEVLPVDFAYEYHKKVPLRLSEQVVMRPSYQLATPPRTSVDSVNLIGPRDMVDTIQEWTTSKLDLSGYSSATSVDVPLNLVPGITTRPREVSVSVDPVPFSEWHLTLPVKAVGVPSDYDVRLSHPSVRYYCVLPEKSLDSLMALEALPFDTLRIPFSGLMRDPDGYWTPPDQLFDPFGHAILIEPARIRFTIIHNKPTLN